MYKFTSLIQKLSYRPVSLLPEAFQSILDTAKGFIAGDFDVLETLINPLPVYEERGKVAVINIQGVLMPKATKLEKLFGVASYAEIRQAVKLAKKSAVEAVILNFDSPGGVTQGVEETAQAIKDLGLTKQVISFTDGDMCSAAYWLGSQAGTVLASQSACVGSIGVYLAYLTYGRALENEGVTANVFQGGNLKTIGLPVKDITSDEKDYLEAGVNKSYADFKNAVSHRSIEEQTMQGQTFNGNEALEVRLIDSIQDDLFELVDYLNAV